MKLDVTIFIFFIGLACFCGFVVRNQCVLSYQTASGGHIRKFNQKIFCFRMFCSVHIDQTARQLNWQKCPSDIKLLWYSDSPTEIDCDTSDSDYHIYSRFLSSRSTNSIFVIFSPDVSADTDICFIW